MSLKFTVLFLLFIGQHSFASDCLKTRGAFDIGSEETKLKIAVVDTCKNKIKEILVEERRPINFLGNVIAEPKNEFTLEFLLQAASEINEMKSLGEEYQVQEWTAVVTSAFRKASNAKESNEKLQILTRLNIAIIDDKLEAEIGFYGALSIADTPKEKLVVMDLGGGSAQISFYDKTAKKVKSYTNELSSRHAKNFLYKVIQKRDTSLRKDQWDPNPISKDEAQKLFSFYSKILFNEFNESKYLDFSSVKLHYQLLQPDTKLVGIGGVIAKGVGRTLTGETYGTLSLQSLNEGLEGLINKSSDELGGGPYVQTDVSNVLLVMAYLNTFAQSSSAQVQYANLSLTEGLLIFPELVKQ
ncbi:MAG: hypothetical protein VX642_08215 [Bdellovibrionota bacterium]|nr:hypothetical protein [Bdellovibrionota bacterium]